MPFFKGVEYRVPLYYARVYLDRSCRCISDRLREHFYRTPVVPSGHMVGHCKKCACAFRQEDIAIEGKHHGRAEKGIQDALLGFALANQLPLLLEKNLIICDLTSCVQEQG